MAVYWASRKISVTSLSRDSLVTNTFPRKSKRIAQNSSSTSYLQAEYNYKLVVSDAGGISCYPTYMLYVYTIILYNIIMYTHYIFAHKSGTPHRGVLNKKNKKSRIAREPQQLEPIAATHMKAWHYGHLLVQSKKFSDVIIT